MEKNKNIRALVFLHENGIISFWDQDSLVFLSSFRLNSPSKKLVFESSMRYLASLTVDGGVEVWKIKGDKEKYWWELNFKTIGDIHNNSAKEN